MTHLLLHKTPNLVSSEPGAAQAFVSALSQWLKKYSPSEYITLFMVVGVSVAAAGIFCALQAANF
jgi:hypothetical protein